MSKLWLCLLRFTYRRLKISTLKTPDGVPGIRDIEHKCSGYEPKKREWNDWGKCEGDGHYLCKECCHLTEEDK